MYMIQSLIEIGQVVRSLIHERTYMTKPLGSFRNTAKTLLIITMMMMMMMMMMINGKR